MRHYKFTIRVYGIYIDLQSGLLVSDEIIRGQNVTKFPGGGLEYGEGTIDCLKRELFEETGTEIKILSHFYTTDFFVKSAFGENEQVISIYYFIEPLSKLTVPVSDRQFDFKNSSDGKQSFRFVQINTISAELFTLPIDRHVAFLLAERYLKSGS